MPSLEPDVIAALQRQVPRLSRKGLERETRKRFKQIKSEMISEFLAHPITLEIQAAPAELILAGL